jgi:tricorn protease
MRPSGIGLSRRENGRDLKQHTKHREIDVQLPSLSKGRICCQLGADIRPLDIAGGSDKAVPITRVSDFDQLRERWVKEAKPAPSDTAKPADAGAA